ncbi:MAG: glutamate--tRNA ligase [candidate division KSB1 bacterium]|nr:glutamate--tRNA ligase [candidate division KSB1 bacterium]MDZ7345570.1 glutamate--tRNA ligase [candidate division KSB1 bacterium]
MVRVRFAPSPTGFVHVGGLRTALYNYLFARRHNGVFVLRIEDTDRSRYVEGAVENLLSVLDWAGLTPDEGPQQGGKYGPYLQSKRLDIYKHYADQLVQAGFAYYAFDTPDEVETARQKSPDPRTFKYDASTRSLMRNSLTLPEEKVQQLLAQKVPYVIRLKVPENRTFVITDLIRGEVSFHSSQVDDQVLIKSDGYPTYHLANVVDDHLMEISHIIRGEEWLSSVPKHLYLYECFGWEPPLMAHLPLIFNPDGSKMSKRDIQSLSQMPSGKVDPDVQSYIQAGYEREAILNYIALLGWSSGDDREVFTLKELEQIFSLDRVNKSPAIFDLAKLKHLNQQHINRMEPERLAAELRSLAENAGWAIEDENYFMQVVKLFQPRLHMRNDFLTLSRYFFEEPTEYDAETKAKRWKEDSGKLVLEFLSEIIKLIVFDKESLEKALLQTAERCGVPPAKIIHPIRLAVTGMGIGPGLYEILELLGKEKVIKRLKRAVEILG